VEWTEDADGVPTLTFETPLTLESSETLLVQDGDGDALEEGDVISLAYTITNAVDGSEVYSTYDSGTPESVTFSSEIMDPALVEVLTGTHVGADFLYGVIDTSSEVPSSVVMAVTVVSSVDNRAEGTAVPPVDGLPVVTLDETGKPSVEIPGNEPPTELVVQPTIKGTGDVVEEGDALTVQYSGWVWADGTQFDSSWEKGSPATFTLAEGQLIAGWVQGLAGQTVGSQVLLVVPPELGYGDEEAGGGSIPPNSTLVFVVDILAAS